jgi:septum formation protein
MQQQSHIGRLILASTSPYRKMLLDRLGLEFNVVSPQVDEHSLDAEAADHLVTRLAQEKAAAVSASDPAAFVIGSDQVALFDEQIVGKPGTVENAVRQLSRFSGNTVLFLTAVNLQSRQCDFESAALVTTKVQFRALDEEEIRRYVELDQPLDCAGGFKSEAAGMMLLKSIQSPDPTAIIGLPLIATCRLLREAGFRLP